jgi:hypothetical protein
MHPKGMYQLKPFPCRFYSGTSPCSTLSVRLTTVITVSSSLHGVLLRSLWANVGLIYCDINLILGSLLENRGKFKRQTACMLLLVPTRFALDVGSASYSAQLALSNDSFFPCSLLPKGIIP